MTDLPLDPVFTAVADALHGDLAGTRRVLLHLGQAGFVAVPIEKAVEEADLRNATVLVLRGYAAENPGLVASLADHFKDRLLILLPADASLDTLNDNDMEAAGWVRLARHQRLQTDLETSHTQLRELLGRRQGENQRMTAAAASIEAVNPPLIVSRDLIFEMARQVERAHADFRIGAFQNMGGPSKSAAARRNAHMTDLSLFMPLLFGNRNPNDQFDAMWTGLHAGRLVEDLGGPRTEKTIRECYICSRKSLSVISKRHPRDQRVFPICLCEDDCITIKPV